MCTNGTRAFIQGSQVSEFEHKIIKRVARIRMGDPLDENTKLDL